MSRPKSRNALLAGNGLKTPVAASSKDDLLRMKYTMEHPEEAIFPLEDNVQHKTFPDYNPWSENDRENKKLVTAECLNNGYFEPPSVSNEYFSARNLIQETLFSSEAGGRSLLQELSLNLTKAYKVRNDAINKITSASHNFKLPPRVTLTASKRDAWLRDLANPEIPLETVASKIPHGIRNKVLLDHMCLLKVPVNRALWFVKCVLCSEQLLLRKKFLSRQSQGSLLVPGTTNASFPTLEIIEGRWIQEWTSQVADYILKFSREMTTVSTPERKTAYQAKLAYLLRLVQSLYIELLVDRTYFLSCIVRFLRDGFPFQNDDLPALLEISKSEVDDESPVLEKLVAKSPVNYGQLLISLTIIKMFWVEVLQHDFLCKQLGESLLLNYFLVERAPTSTSTSTSTRTSPAHTTVSSFALPFSLKENLLTLISTSIVSLFRHNSNAFILPDFWPLIGGLLYRILGQSSIARSGEHQQNFETVFRLIHFRNESLMLNMRYTIKDEKRLGGSHMSKTQSDGISKVGSSVQPSFGKIGYNSTSVNRSNEDSLAFISQLDQMNLRTGLASSLRPTSNNQNRWRTNLKILIKWCTSTYRDMGPSSEKILILCNFIKKKVLQPMTVRGSANLKAEFESEILESIFSLAPEPRETISMYNLFVLVNEFYQLKVISISSYLRKIIACGIFYISSSQSEMDTETQNDPQISFHLSILSNLPVLNNKQHYQILTQWTPNGEKISSNYDRGMEISKTYVLKSLVADNFPKDYEAYLEEIGSFSVGVKFLLSNWLTSQIKTTITQSPRLIHISPSTIARIYEFYVSMDNITVFFKSFVRFLLKNEDKVIIYYLDTLHYIGQLLQHHYLLVNFLPGSNVDRVSAAYELYNLIIDAYQDLSTREPVIYNFRPLWEFMNQSVDKKISESASINQIKSHDPELEKYIFSKETAESPLKVQVPAPRRNQVYSAEHFVSNLNKLLMSELAVGATAEDISDYLNEIGVENVGITPEDVMNEAKSSETLTALFQNWTMSFSTLNEGQEIAYFKLIKLCMMRGGKHKQALTVLIAGVLAAASNALTFEPFLIKLIFHGILSFEDVPEIIKKESERDSNKDFDQLSFRLIFGGEDILRNLPKCQAVMFSIYQLEFQSKNLEGVFYLLIQKLKTVGVSIGSDFDTHYGPKITKVLMSVLINYKHVVLPVMSSELSKEVIESLCHKFLETSVEVSGLSWVNLAHLANEFSLPFLQLWLRVLTSGEKPSESHMGESILSLLDVCEFSIETTNSYFGELFNYLEWDEKRKVFDYLETYFLTHKEVLTLWAEEEMSEVKLDVVCFSRKNQQGVELLPVFKDFFKKFSVSSADSLGISFEKFRQFSDLLLSILELVDNDVVVKSQSRQIHDIISIFLRLLIIHSASLTDLIAKHDSVHFGFLKNMMVLLNSAYLANGQDKLKILLFDLLLQMKGSLTQALVLSPSEDIMGTSPQVLGAGTKPEPSPESGNNIDSPNGTNSVSTMSMILNLPEPGMSGYNFGADDEMCPITLDYEELNHDSDVALANDRNLILVAKEENVDADQDPFAPPNAKQIRQFRIESVGLLEDTSSGINNGCLSLSMFGAYTTKENPY